MPSTHHSYIGPYLSEDRHAGSPRSCLYQSGRGRSRQHRQDQRRRRRFELRLADNGRQSFNLAADTNLQDGLVFTLQASHIVTFDNNLNRRFAQTVLSTVLQFQFFGTAK